jgi:hypothetical protein
MLGHPVEMDVPRSGYSNVGFSKLSHLYKVCMLKRKEVERNCQWCVIICCDFYLCLIRFSGVFQSTTMCSILADPSTSLHRDKLQQNRKSAAGTITHWNRRKWYGR